MKTLLAIAALTIGLMFVVTSCNDRFRDTCETNPDGPRCDTSIGEQNP